MNIAHCLRNRVEYLAARRAAISELPLQRLARMALTRYPRILGGDRSQWLRLFPHVLSFELQDGVAKRVSMFEE